MEEPELEGNSWPCPGHSHQPHHGSKVGRRELLALPRTFPQSTPWIKPGQPDRSWKGAPDPAQDIPTSHGLNVGSLTDALSWSHAHGAVCHPAGDTGVPGEAQPCPARLLLGTAAIRAKHGALGRAGEADNLQAQAVTACSSVSQHCHHHYQHGNWAPRLG